MSILTQNPIDQTSSTSMANVYQSRWGWHGLSYPQFRLLKKLHKQVWEEYRTLCHIHRAMAKQPQNRGTLPSMTRFEFVKDFTAWSSIKKLPVYSKHWDGSEWYTQRYERSINKRGSNDCNYTLTAEAVLIIDEYRKLRVPALYPASVAKPHPDLLVLLTRKALEEERKERSGKNEGREENTTGW